ncbi:MAG: ABC transporter substrate-binding protein, partial [Gammaproteobacteria bacterium]|nr:ABC transporter substrate-binding protein [Gammaproteobacteria bacterium]
MKRLASIQPHGRHAFRACRVQAALGALLLVGLNGVGPSANAQTSTGVDSLAPVAMGRALYRGELPWRQPPTLHGVTLAAGAQACAACHGAQGQARTEAGVAIPSVQWQRLSQATDVRPAYADTAQLLRALEEGRASDGRPLSAPMPRFAFTEDERRALIAYLQVLGTDADPVPGVDAKRIVLGSVLPLSGPQAATGERIRQALLQRMAQVNAAGGVFGRQLELVAVDAGPDPASASEAAVGLVHSHRVFALVASLLPEPDAKLLAALARHDTAMVATLGVPVSTPAREPLVTWLLPSLATQVAALASEMAHACPSATRQRTERIRVYYQSESAARSLRAALDARAGLPHLDWQAAPDAVAVRRKLQDPDAGTQAIALLPASLADVARQAMSEVEGVHCLGTLAAISGEASAAGRTHELVALPMPPVVRESAADAPLWPLLADSALAAVAEALARA